MALKDLPGSVVLDFKILLDQLPLYIEEVAEKKAAKPKGKLSKASTLTIRYPNGSPSALMTALYQTLKTNIKVEASTVATFSKGYTTKENWANNFFIIRTKVVGVVPSGDPVLKAFDAVWTALEGITAVWKLGYK